MSTPEQKIPEKKKETDYFEWIVYIAATIIVLMLAAHWVGLY